MSTDKPTEDQSQLSFKLCHPDGRLIIGRHVDGHLVYGEDMEPDPDYDERLVSALEGGGVMYNRDGEPIAVIPASPRGVPLPPPAGPRGS